MKGAMTRAVTALAVGLALFWSLFPFYWAIVTSLKTGTALFAVEAWPARPTLENYRAALGGEGFVASLANSVAVATVTVVASLLLALLAAYPLARTRFRGRSLALNAFLAVSMFPQIAVLSGLFELVRFFGLYNTRAGLALTYLLLTLPFSVWTLTAFLRELPRELEEAAIVDGARPWVILTRVFAPLLAPAVVATGLIGFVAAFNEFLFALTFTLTERSRTVPVAIALMSGGSEHELPWGRVLAAAVVVTLPVVGLVVVFQRRFVSGLTAGALKG